MLWARQAAWLTAIPEGQKRSRYQLELQRFGAVSMPDLGAFDQVAEYFNEVGPLSFEAAGTVPISYSEVKGWAEATGTEVDHWLANILVAMSRQYYYQLSSKAPSAPYQAERTEEEMATMRKNVAAKIKKLF